MNDCKTYQPVVASLLNKWRPQTVLDAPSGSGWLRELLTFPTQLEGLDLYAPGPPGYHAFGNCDLDAGLPSNLGVYEAIVCCEGIEHFASPGLFFQTAMEHLAPGGWLIVTTPNTWFPAARLQFLTRGFFPSFPCLVGQIQRGSHMHIMPWSFPQLYLHLRLRGFDEITLHDVDERKPKRSYEWLFGLPQLAACRRKQRKAQSSEERAFWAAAGSRQSVYGRR
jgi:SAM-dependent methyltransferase